MLLEALCVICLVLGILLGRLSTYWRANSRQRVDAARALDLLLLAGRLKTTKRTGWLQRRIINPESIADHMYRVAIATFVVGRGDGGVNPDRALRLAIVHDLVEAIAGDITPEASSGISKARKRQLERRAMDQIVEMVGGVVGREIGALWEEYEEAKTPEARLVKDLDKLEMIVQAYEYELAQPNADLQCFFDSTRGKFRHHEAQRVVRELVRRRGRD